MEAKELQERLREAAALGDAEEVRRLLAAGADVNSRNEIDGWTCLHWACKRSHAPVVALLLDAGADRRIPTAAGQLAAQLTAKPHIRRILGATEEENDGHGACDGSLPAAGPPLPRGCTEESPPRSAAQSPNESASTSSSSQSEASPASSAAPEHAPRTSQAALPSPPAAARLPGPPDRRERAEQGGACQPPAHSTAPGGTAAQSQAGPGPAPAFQPLFLTGAFPYNMQELVLKVRVQNLRDDDFIEIELDRQELTYQDLLRVSCCELGVDPQHVERIRKLPNTVLRKDKDVARLQDFQELELVLVKSDSSPFRNAASALTERPCYNSSASKLTY
ncbi:ankyrin repeat domain-containing protein 40-like [Numida meleagris]|uniref:ankyrin repeat domain-containing protein 40-like n=1 Tax=Numida meleagris TaxID=8996 RepID=UPI000B3DB323|nr:ankyrin repeat domain-containing protein 40-like [Numida meleagris]